MDRNYYAVLGEGDVVEFMIDTWSVINEKNYIPIERIDESLPGCIYITETNTFKKNISDVGGIPTQDRLVSALNYGLITQTEYNLLSNL